ncbi:putative mitochondrial chaperone BCS1-B [Cladobotryum mycophilum]|uniref:Mitochondrial chaperone BCS1-B n=1 Tax=Cladobotryum mycophilum TaxID=491253 RepID=A0ABR0S791_9HYPO
MIYQELIDRYVGGKIGSVVIIAMTISYFAPSLLGAAPNLLTWLPSMTLPEYDVHSIAFLFWVAGNKPQASKYNAVIFNDPKTRYFSWDKEKDSVQRPGDRDQFVCPNGVFIFRSNNRLFVGNKFTLYVLWFDNTPIRRLMKDVLEQYYKTKDLRCFYNDDNSWVEQRRPKKSQNTYFSEKSELLKQDATQFFESKLAYDRRGDSWRRCYFFSGASGSGKTSMSEMIASELNLPIYRLFLGTVNSKELLKLCSCIPPRSLLLLEDIDRVKLSSDGLQDPNPKHIDQQVLNSILDGSTGSEGVLRIISANHPDKLDEALIRPGRVDLTIEFRAILTKDTILGIFSLYFPHSEKVHVARDEYHGRTPAELKCHLQMHKNSDEAMQWLRGWLDETPVREPITDDATIDATIG